MGRYVDGFVIPVKKKRVKEYQKMAAAAGKMWMKYGALEYVECVGQDMNVKMPPGMKLLTFPALAKTKPDETVLFSFIIFKSRKHRDAVNKKVMANMDPDMCDPNDMPFDIKKMAYGGFESIVDLVKKPKRKKK